MKQFGLILKLLLGIVVGILIGTYAGEWVGTQWLLNVVVFGKSILKDVIQFFLPLIMISFLAIGIADLGRRAGKMLGYTVGLSYLYTIIACALGAVVIILFFQIFPSLTEVAMEKIEPRKLPPNIVNIRIPFPFSEAP